MALDTALVSSAASLQKELDELAKFDLAFKHWDKEVSEIVKDSEAFKGVMQDKAKIDAHMKVLNNCMPQVKKLLATLAGVESLVAAHTSHFHSRLLKMGGLVIESKKMQTSTAANIQAAKQLSDASTTMFTAVHMGLGLIEMEAAEKDAKRPDLTQAMDELYPIWEKLSKEVEAYRQETAHYLRVLTSHMPK